ncbi:hypothetical protein C8R44DRAFT_745982 [Mycena epipterygia]|nr:hypothetical protein C8R44DRAFT_745982 [Mycena epipterygia]
MKGPLKFKVYTLTKHLQLDWHIANAVKVSTTSEESSALGIPKAKSGANGRGNRDSRFECLKTAIKKRSEILEDFDFDSSIPDLEPQPTTEPEVDAGGRPVEVKFGEFKIFWMMVVRGK